MHKALIIDDERLARNELKKLLLEFPEVEVIGEAANATEGIEKIEDLSPDLVFLDIQMPGKTGFDMLLELEKAPHVIFTTAYDEFALKAFEVNALDYLMKPVEPKRLADALHKLHQAEEKEMAAGAGKCRDPVHVNLQFHIRVAGEQGDQDHKQTIQDVSFLLVKSRV